MDKEAEEFEQPEQWEEEGSRSPGQPVSAVLSVRFSRDELIDVRTAAGRVGQKVSEFVRRAALHHARSETGLTVELIQSSGVIYSGALYFATPASRTQPHSRAAFSRTAA